MKIEAKPSCTPAWASVVKETGEINDGMGMLGVYTSAPYARSDTPIEDQDEYEGQSDD